MKKYVLFVAIVLFSNLLHSVGEISYQEYYDRWCEENGDKSEEEYQNIYQEYISQSLQHDIIRNDEYYQKLQEQLIGRDLEKNIAQYMAEFRFMRFMDLGC